MQKTKEQHILNILRHRSLTKREAYHYNDPNLNTTVSKLRAKGYPIVDEWVEVPTAFGTTEKVKRYWLDVQALKKRESEKKHA